MNITFPPRELFFIVYHGEINFTGILFFHFSMHPTASADLEMHNLFSLRSVKAVFEKHSTCLWDLRIFCPWPWTTAALSNRREQARIYCQGCNCSNCTFKVDQSNRFSFSFFMQYIFPPTFYTLHTNTFVFI